MRRRVRFPSRRCALSSRSLKGRYKTVGGDNGLASAPLPAGSWGFEFQDEVPAGKERLSTSTSFPMCTKTRLTTHGTFSLSHQLQPSCTFQQERRSRRMTPELKSALLQSLCKGPQSSGSSSGRRVESALLDLFLMPWKSNYKVKLHIPQLL